MYREHTYNEGLLHRLVPIWRKDVVPGESVDASLDVRIRTPNFINPVLSGGLMTVATFYVPWRLMWSGWINFVTERNGVSGTNLAATVPTATNSWDYVFEKRGGKGGNVWGRRAYKHVYNQFFGDKDMGMYYPDLTDDADTSVLPVRGLDQLLSKLVMTGSITEQTYTVVGNAIPLNDFRHALETARQMRRRDMTGNKYVDALLGMGVKLDWRVQMAPELLALHKCEFDAKVTPASNKSGTTDADQTLGQFSSYFDVVLSHRTGRKFFAEHGTLISVATMRPYTWNEAQLGSFFQWATTYDSQFWGDNMEGKTGTVFGDLIGAAAGSSAQLGRFQNWESGQMVMGDHGSQPWVMSRDEASVPNNIHSLVYPTNTRTQVQGNLKQGADLAVLTRVQAQVLTPIGKGVHRI